MQNQQTFEVQQWLARNLVSHSEYRTRKRELWKQWAKEIADELFFKLKYVPEDFTNADLVNWHQGVWQNFAESRYHDYAEIADKIVRSDARIISAFKGYTRRVIDTGVEAFAEYDVERDDAATHFAHVFRCMIQGYHIAYPLAENEPEVSPQLAEAPPFVRLPDTYVSPEDIQDYVSRMRWFDSLFHEQAPLHTHLTPEEVTLIGQYRAHFLRLYATEDMMEGRIAQRPWTSVEDLRMYGVKGRLVPQEEPPYRTLKITIKRATGINFPKPVKVRIIFKDSNGLLHPKHFPHGLDDPVLVTAPADRQGRPVWNQSLYYRAIIPQHDYCNDPNMVEKMLGKAEALSATLEVIAADDDEVLGRVSICLHAATAEAKNNNGRTISLPLDDPDSITTGAELVIEYFYPLLSFLGEKIDTSTPLNFEQQFERALRYNNDDLCRLMSEIGLCMYKYNQRVLYLCSVFSNKINYQEECVRLLLKSIFYGNTDYAQNPAMMKCIEDLQCTDTVNNTEPDSSPQPQRLDVNIVSSSSVTHTLKECKFLAETLSFLERTSANPISDEGYFYSTLPDDTFSLDQYTLRNEPLPTDIRFDRAVSISTLPPIGNRANSPTTMTPNFGLANKRRRSTFGGTTSSATMDLYKSRSSIWGENTLKEVPSGLPIVTVHPQLIGPRPTFVHTSYHLAKSGDKPDNVLILDDDLRNRFDELDVDGNSFLDKEEFGKVYQQLESYGVDITDGELHEILAKFNALGDDRLSYDEFALLMLKVAQR